MLTVKLNYYLRRALSGHKDIRIGEGKVLCESSTSMADRAVFLDGQLDKVVEVLRTSTREHEFATIEGGVRHHQETRLFDVGRAVLFDGTIYKGGRKRNFGRMTPAHKEVVRLDTVCLASNPLGSRFFGHWLRDDCPAYELAAKHAIPLCIRTPSWPDKQYYADAFRQDWTPTDRAHIDRLLLLSDFAQNELKLERYATLRERLLSRLSAREPNGIIYLKRGSSGARRSMENEDAIIELLSSQGIATCEMETTPLTEVLARLLGAKLVISVEGSQLSHTVYTLRQGAGVLVIEPPHHFNASTKGWMERLGIAFGFVVGDPSAAGYTLDPDDLLATIDLMLTHIERNRA